jgi:AcrR family transcriptional regulator
MPRIPAEQRRRALAEAALRVMARDGVAAATTRAIVAEADMSLSAFHYCFRSKNELLAGLVDALVEREMAAALATLRPGADVNRALRKGLRAYWSLVEAAPEEHQVTYELTQYATRKAGLTDLPRRQYESYFEGANAVLRALADTAGVRWSLPVPVLARMLVTVLDGLTLGWLADRNSAQALAVLDRFAEQIAGYAQPRRVRRAVAS